MDLFLGIDGGGTRTRVVLMDGHEVELGRMEGTATGLDKSSVSDCLEEIEMLCGKVLGGIEFSKVNLCAGLAGAGDTAIKKSLESAIQELGIAKSVSVRTDAEVTFMDAFGQDETGILLIAGTGSTALGRGINGSKRVGGWGSIIGDEGSGYRIGLESLRSVIKTQDGRMSSTSLLTEVLGAVGVEAPRDLVTWVSSAEKSEVAALANSVCRLANQGEETSSFIVGKAIDDLVAHVKTLVEQLGPWTSSPQIVLHGGLIDSSGPLHHDLISSIKMLDCVIFEGKVDGARGACRMAACIQAAKQNRSSLGVFP